MAVRVEGLQPHLLGFGPRIVKMDVDYGTARPFSESEMEDNQETWLTATDLVFVDTRRHRLQQADARRVCR